MGYSVLAGGALRSALSLSSIHSSLNYMLSLRVPLSHSGRQTLFSQALQHKHIIYITGDYNPLYCDSLLSQGTSVEWAGFSASPGTPLQPSEAPACVQPLFERWDLKRFLN